MASYTPPTEQLPIFDNSVFNAVNDSTILTVSIANLLYLRKTYADTATALETFNAGIATSNLQALSTSSTMLIASEQTSGPIYIGTNVAADNARTAVIHIGDSNNMPVGSGVHINNGTGCASNVQIMNGTGSSGNVNIHNGGNTSSGTVNIANIGTNSTAVNIGSTTGTGVITIDTANLNNDIPNGVAAIYIGASATTKYIKINNPTVSCQTSIGNLQIGYSTVQDTVFYNAVNTVTNTGLALFDKQTIGKIGIGCGGSSPAIRSSTADINIANQASNSCAINIMNGGNLVSGSVNIANVGTNSTAINIGSKTGTGAIKLETNSALNDFSTPAVSIGTGATDKVINIGNESGSTVYLCGLTFKTNSINNRLGANINVGNLQTSSGELNLGSNGARTTKILMGNTTVTSTIDILTTGILNLGMSTSTVNVNGNLTLGTAKNITLQPTAGYVAPTADTMLGGITDGTFNVITFPLSTTPTDIASVNLVKATYMISFQFQIDCAAAPTQAWVGLGGTMLPLPSNYRFGYTTIASPTNFGIAGTFPLSVTTAGTLTLVLTLVGTINSINVKKYQAVRIA